MKAPTRQTAWRILGIAGGLAAVLVAAGQLLAIEEPTFRDRLEKGLRARTKSEFAFLNRVVESVEDRRLPQKLVDRVFFWARKKAEEQEGSKRRRPMIYFEPAMKMLAERLGLDLKA